MIEIPISKKYYTGEQVQEIIRLATFNNQGKALWLLEKAAAMPAADVEEVIRCRDCEHWKPWSSDRSFCTILDRIESQEDFCSEGKRRETE